MWTVVWTDNSDKDHFDRLECEAEVIKKLIELRQKEHLSDDAILVFPPDSEISIQELIGSTSE